MAALVSKITDNRSFLTVDQTGNNYHAAQNVDPEKQYLNVSNQEGWQIAAKLPCLAGADRSQCQFGYWNNDNFSFADDTGMIYFMLILTKDDGTRGLIIQLCCKLPKEAWSLVQATQPAERWYNDTPGQEARNAQRALARVICECMNEDAVEVSMASFKTTAASWKDLLYLDSVSYENGLGLANLYQYFSDANPTFLYEDGTESVVTRNRIYLQVEPGWTGSFAFMDGAYGFYNTASGVFASGAGYYARGGRVRVVNYQSASLNTVTQSPYPYLANIDTRSAVLLPCYFPVIPNLPLQAFANDIPLASIYDTYAVDNYGPFLSVSQLRTEMGAMKMYVFPRSATLLPGKYYVLSCDEVTTSQKAGDLGIRGTFINQSTVGVIAGTQDGRNEWSQHPTEATHAMKAMERDVATMYLVYTFQRDDGAELVCEATRAIPNNAKPLFRNVLDGELPYIAKKLPLYLYFPSEEYGKYPIKTSGANLPSNTFITTFQTVQIAS